MTSLSCSVGLDGSPYIMLTDLELGMYSRLASSIQCFFHLCAGTTGLHSHAQLPKIFFLVWGASFHCFHQAVLLVNDLLLILHILYLTTTEDLGFNSVIPGKH